MLRFTCPSCDKQLRAADEKAGAAVKCPACGQKITIPSPDEEPEELEERDQEEEEQPKVRKRKRVIEEEEESDDEEEDDRPRSAKKKRRRAKQRNLDAARGKVQVVVIICVMMFLHAVSWIQILTSPAANSPEVTEAAKQQLRQGNPKLSKEEVDKTTQLIGKGVKYGIYAFVGAYFLVDSLLLLFLYLRHDWARILLAILYLLLGLFAGFGLIGLPGALKLVQGAQAVILVASSILAVGLPLGFSCLLFASQGIKAYTSG